MLRQETSLVVSFIAARIIALVRSLAGMRVQMVFKVLFECEGPAAHVALERLLGLVRLNMPIECVL